MEVPIIIAVVLSIIGMIFFFTHRYEKKRTAQFAKLAGDLQLEFHALGFGPTRLPVVELHLFDRGRGQEARNLLWGEIEGTELAIFDYRYVTGYGKDKRVHKQTVLSFHSSDLKLPKFELRPEGFFHKVGQAFGYADIDFPSHPIFSERFLLRGEDEEAVRILFSPDLLNLFESQPGISVEGAGDRMIIYRKRRRRKPEDVRAFFEEGLPFFQLLQRRL